MGLAHDIDALRDEQDMTYRRLADLTGISLNTVYSALAYRRNQATWNHLDKFCEALGVDAEVYRAKYPEFRVGGRVDIYEDDDDEDEYDDDEDDSSEAEPICTTNGCRYDQILAAVKAGIPDEKIISAWQGLTGDVLNVYHQIANGTLKHMAKRGGAYDKANASALERFYAAVYKQPTTGSTSPLRERLEMDDEEWEDY